MDRRDEGGGDTRPEMFEEIGRETIRPRTSVGIHVANSTLNLFMGRHSNKVSILIISNGDRNETFKIIREINIMSIKKRSIIIHKLTTDVVP